MHTFSQKREQIRVTPYPKGPESELWQPSESVISRAQGPPERGVSRASGDEEQSGPAELGPHGAPETPTFSESVQAPGCVWMLQGNVGITDPDPRPPTWNAF